MWQRVEAARALVGKLGDAVGFYKIGLELAMCGGLDLARELARSQKRVFLDMKLLDIENTVERATRNAAAIGATFLTVHALDRKTLRAAMAGKAGTDLGSSRRHRPHQPRCEPICASKASTPRPPISLPAAPALAQRGRLRGRRRLGPGGGKRARRRRAAYGDRDAGYPPAR